MCGIFGFLSANVTEWPVHKVNQALHVLTASAQIRGKDSSGLAFCDNESGTIRVFRGALELQTLHRAAPVDRCRKQLLSEYSRGRDLAIIGHSRLVTNGSQLNDHNNQPVVKNQIVAIHNGIIVNDSDLWEKNPQLRREFEIDTEVLLAILSERINHGESIPTALSLATNAIQGTVSAAMLFAETGSLALTTNNGSLYLISDERSWLAFASEEYPLKQLARLLLPKAFTSRQVESNHGVVFNLSRGSFERFSFAEVIGRPRTDTDPQTARKYAIQIETIEVADPKGELILDVGVIARAPDAKRLEAQLEFNSERVAQIRRCTKCILPETFPFIWFDTSGVCNYCHSYVIKNAPRPLTDLTAILDGYRKPGHADCIVPFSGGRDSTYALHFVRRELNLNPIAFTYDWGMVTDLGRRNIARVCGKLGVENIIVAADIHNKRKNIQRNVSAWLRNPALSMVPLFMAGDKMFYFYIDQVKKQTGIKLNVWGINPLENTDFKVGFLGVPPDPLKKRIYSLSLKRHLKLIKGVSKAVVENPAYVNRSIPDTLKGFVARSVRPHRDYFHLFDFVRWDEHEIDKLLFEEFSWERAIDTPTTWRIGDGTAAFYNYIYFTVAGFSEHDTFRSNQIREGMLSRPEALAKANEENRPRFPTIKWYLDIIGIDYEAAIRTINSMPKHYA